MSPDVLKQLEWLVQPHTGSVPALYDEVAPLYESFRAQWLALAGARTEEAMVQDLAAVLRSGDRVLDAGCGTGAMSRTILELPPDVDLTLVDASEAMLERAGELGSRRMVGDVADLPFEEGSFDVITCAWVIETVPDPAAAATELLRVLDPDGFLLVSFCTLPDGWLSRAGSLVLRQFVTRAFAGQFLEPEEVPWHDCDRSRKISFHGGLSTYVLLRKCCAPTAESLPARAVRDAPPTFH